MNNKKVRLSKIVLRRLRMKLKKPFQASYGTMEERAFDLIEMIDEDGFSGWGECVAFEVPWYTEETVETARYVMEEFLIPLLAQEPVEHPDEVSERFSPIRGNNMAKAALEGAMWDLYAKKQGVTLSEALGGEKKEIDVGVSIGIQPSVGELMAVIRRHVEEGYKRIKVKIKPGWDVEVVREIRRHFPDVSLMADANSAYTLADTKHLKQLDDFNLMMIEQPLGHDDIIDHAELQKHLRTPICLDESICSLKDARKAVELGSCGIINIKIGRVGGLTKSRKIHDYCAEKGVPVWCGGMLEAGVGRAHNIALTTLTGFTLPGDTSGSSRYWEEDIIDPEVIVHDGVIKVRSKPGIGYEIDRQVLERCMVESKTIDLG